MRGGTSGSSLAPERKDSYVAKDKRLERLLKAIEDAQTKEQLKLAEAKLAAYRRAQE